MLGSILFIVGFLLIAGAVLITALPKFLGSKIVHDPETGKRVLETRKPFIGYFSLGIMTLIGLVLILSNGAIYYAEPGINYLVQYPWGTQIGETAPGYHLKWWGTAEPFKKFITVKADDYDVKDVSAMIPPIEARFTDAVLANIDVTTRYQLPVNQKEFLKIAVAFRTQGNLENSTLIPVLKEVVRNAARTMTAQDYIAGKGGEFENAILDQLRYGTYILDVKEMRPEGKININEEDGRVIDQSQMVRYEVNFKYDANGEIIRKPTAIADYNIIVAQANVSNVDPEVKFKEMLAKQRDAAAEASVKKQEAKRAEYDKQKIIAEGETMKASIKIEQEMAQITKLIAAETSRKEAEIQLAEAKIQKMKEKEYAEQRKIAADAAAYEKRKVIEADGALEQKLAALVQMNHDNATALASRPVPQYYFAGGGSDEIGASGYDTEMIRQLKLMNLNTIRSMNIDMSVTK